MIGADNMLLLGMIGLLALIVASAFALKGWQGWLEIRKLEIASSGRDEAQAPPTGNRIEIADLKERVRKLEQIASGIEL